MAHSFTDSLGRTWLLEVNVASIKRVRALLGVDLMEVIDGRNDLLTRLAGDPILLCDVLYALCKPQCEAMSPPVSDEQFGAALAGDAIDNASTAMLEALVAFCPSPRHRANLGRMIKATASAQHKSEELVTAKIEAGTLDRVIAQATTKANREIDRHLDKLLGDLSSDAPASSASTPTPSPSANSA